MVKAVPNVWSFLRYIRKIIKERRVNPQDDLISALARAEEAGDKLSEDELLAMVFLLLVAGHETTVNLIGNGALALLEHPDQMAKLRSDPGLIRPAVEELLRYTSPVESATERYAREDVTIAGVTIPRGEMVGAVIAWLMCVEGETVRGLAVITCAAWRPFLLRTSRSLMTHAAVASSRASARMRDVSRANSGPRSASARSNSSAR